MPSTRPAAVIVGAGLMGRWHLDAARRSGARIVAVVDRDPGRAEALAGPALACGSLADALRQPVDVVHICTPLDSHVGLCHQALAAGCHVIIEKPATPNADDAISLGAAARAAGRMVVPVHQFVFQRGVQQIRARRPTLGTIRHFEFATASAGAERSGGDPDTVAAEIVPHALSLARYLLGPNVSALAWQLDRAAAGEWRAHAAMPGGCSITALISLRARPTFAALRMLGEQGSATADLFHDFAVFEAGRSSRRYKMIRPLAVGARTARRAAANLIGRAWRGERAYPGLRALCAATYAAAQGNGPPPFAADELIDVGRARDRLIQLASTGGVVVPRAPAA
ncbi:MAG TPA: Gfo/Idh/MocA family oxidoreductase [Gemmatimonadales bacterium]|jgi:predicted dehydrogenase